MCTQLGKKKILGGGTIDSLFKRPLTLHILLPKERQVCSAGPPGSGLADIYGAGKLSRLQQNLSLMIINISISRTQPLTAAADCISPLDSLQRSRRAVTARPFQYPQQQRLSGRVLGIYPTLCLFSVKQVKI